MEKRQRGIEEVLMGLNAITDNARHWTPEQIQALAQTLAALLSLATRHECQCEEHDCTTPVQCLGCDGAPHRCASCALNCKPCACGVPGLCLA